MAGFHRSLWSALRAFGVGEQRRWGLPDQQAEVHATQLLIRSLSGAQRAQYEKHRYFDVIGGSTGTCYRIRYGAQMNVDQLDHTGRRTNVLCFVPEGGLPIGDIMLAQKIALEHYEKEAVEVAILARQWHWDLDAERRPRRYPRWRIVG
jgi:hypothetical protein